MCISLLIAGTLLSVAGSVTGAMASSSAAQSEAKWNEYNQTVQNNQLKQEQDMTRLKAQETEASRLEQDRKMRGSNYAFLAMSGASDNISFFEGADKANADAARRDVGTLRLNSEYSTNRIADQIAVNKANVQFGYDKADMESSSAFTKAAFSVGSSLTSFGQTAFKYKT